VRSRIAVCPAYFFVRFSTLIMTQFPPEQELIPSVKQDHAFLLQGGEG
jgi:hypothetical protein